MMTLGELLVRVRGISKQTTIKLIVEDEELEHLKMEGLLNGVTTNEDGITFYAGGDLSS